MIKYREDIDKRKKVFVAMSGGVDSSVVAALLKDEGYDVVGVTMCFSITHPDSKKPSCCGVDGIQDAKRAAQILGIPHYVLDFAKDINDYIIDDFVSEYLNGRTPNPCSRCNQHLKFGSLYEKVKTLGGDYLATGHYAKIHYDPSSGRHLLKEAEDNRKDQSYFLASMKKETLSSVLFPLGDLTKTEVRALARKYQLNTADKPESQDICFVPDGGYTEFFRRRFGESVFVPGDFVDETGKVIGRHKGILNYTIGQREKLGIALGHPVYVNRIDKEKNTVYVGPLSLLYSSGLIAKGFNPVSRDFKIGEVASMEVKVRYNAPVFKATATLMDRDTVSVIFDEPQKSITPGQTVVFYENDVVLAGGVIEKSISCTSQDLLENAVHTS